ncbi:MAG: UDP-glucose 4-epimerase GalE [Cyanobacteria bacterium K_DeepCast_35m_m2_023]|nr:UDP-glucose 4-epimerase GalE [Cyanobacteria bacterium K_DeepCast_35m_m2_023]
MGNLLVTGGAGYIGSHSCLALLHSGHSLVVIDDFSNGSLDALRTVAQLRGLHPCSRLDPLRSHRRRWLWQNGDQRLTLLEGDIRQRDALQEAFEADSIDAVLHFAGLKAVAESVAKPLDYWDINVGGSRQVLDVMADNQCRTFVFSSSATVYGMAEQVPIPEVAPIKPINPYGQTKAAVEQMLQDLSHSSASADGAWRIACLRYFNPVGAHDSGSIGEDPDGIPSNLLPLICQVASGKIDSLNIYGNDWNTPDGTGVRDYVHVMDLAEGHCAALETIMGEEPQMLVLNLGSGEGHSVLQMIEAFERINSTTIPFTVCGRRNGDSAISVADASLAHDRLGWKTRRELADICRDAWRWHLQNPSGFAH